MALRMASKSSKVAALPVKGSTVACNSSSEKTVLPNTSIFSTVTERSEVGAGLWEGSGSVSGAEREG